MWGKCFTRIVGVRQFGMRKESGKGGLMKLRCMVKGLDFKLGVKDEYGDIVLRVYGTALNGTSANASSASFGDGTGDKRQYSWQVFTLDTTNLTIAEPVEFNIKAKAHRGSQTASCVGEINVTKDLKAFTIYPSVCALQTTLSAESKTFHAEPNQLTEFSKQSYMSGVVVIL